MTHVAVRHQNSEITQNSTQDRRPPLAVSMQDVPRFWNWCFCRCPLAGEAVDLTLGDRSVVLCVLAVLLPQLQKTFHCCNIYNFGKSSTSLESSFPTIIFIFGCSLLACSIPPSICQVSAVAGAHFKWQLRVNNGIFPFWKKTMDI